MSEDLRKNCDLFDSNKNKSCDKDNKDCCCGIDTIRKILKLFQRNNLSVTVVTEDEVTGGLISNLTGDVVYLNPGAVGDRPTQFVPLCNIVEFNTSTSDPILRDEILNQIQNLINSTSNNNPCCCSDGIANTINYIRRSYTPPTQLCFVTPNNIVNGCFDLANIVRANDDVVLIIQEFNTPIPGIRSFTIYSTCKIDSMFIQ